MKQPNFLIWVLKRTENLVMLFPDWITGKSETMRHKYYKKYGTRDCSQRIKQNKIHTMTVYMGITALFTVVLISSMIGQASSVKELKSIQRPGIDSGEKRIPVEVQMKYKGHKLTRAITIKVKQKEMNEKEKLKLLNTYADRLENVILGNNRDLDHISTPLNLIEKESEDGITINWTSDQPEIVSDKGEVDLINAKDKQKIMLKADLALDDITINKIYEVRIDTDTEGEAYIESLAGRLKDAVDKLEESTASSNMILPQDLGDGIKIKWYQDQSNNVQLFAAAFLLTILISFFKRYDQINKEIKEIEDSVISDLPELLNKLVLLLNAGLVVSTAFSKIVYDYEAFYQTGNLKKRNSRYLYEELSEIHKRINQSNASLINELKDLSQRCGVKELVRITAVISDNWDKGSMMAEKLEGESELLWIRRKKRAEEKGKLAETKLTFPLMILLIVLIMVTIAPAMLEM